MGALSKKVVHTFLNWASVALVSFRNIVKVNCYLADMDNFAKFNEIFQEYFTDSKPARTTFQAGKLPKNAQ